MDLRREANRLDGQAGLHDYAAANILQGMMNHADRLREEAAKLEATL
jgi:hypothetical protein